MLKYIELNDEKQPITSFDTTYICTKELRNAGLMLNSKVVVVDFDNDNYEEEKIIEYFKKNYPTLIVKTTKGVHFYYSIPNGLSVRKGADKITTSGFQVDYLTGTKSYAIIKHKGKDRDRNMELKLKDLPPLPQLLYPLPKTKTNISGMSEGDGRNSALFYHLRCIRELYKEFDIKEFGTFINNNILAEPLKQKELESTVESVLHQEINSNGVYNGNLEDMIGFAKFLVKELDIKLYHNQLYFRKGIYYSNSETLLLREITKYQDLKRSKDNELRHQLLKYSDLIDIKSHQFYVKVRNGVILEDNVIDMDCGFTPFFLDVTYEPNAYDNNVDDFLNDITCNQITLRETLEEIMGHILLVNKFPHNVFFLNGSGKNGKSTFVTMLSNFTKDLTSHISLSKFEDDTSILSLTGKMLNISDDVNASYIEKSEKLKLMSAGNELSIRPIYSSSTNFKNTSTFILTANELPVFKDKSNGFYRRVLIIPFDFIVNKRNPNLDNLLSTDNAKSYILNLALKGLCRIIKNGYEMTENDIVKSATEEYKLDTDSIYSYLQDYPDIDGKWFKDVYLSYEMYCEENDKETLPRIVFSRKLKNYGYHTAKEERVKENIYNKSGKDRKINKK